MKKLLLATVFCLSFLFVAMQVKADDPGPCDEGPGCPDYWTQAGNPYIYHYPLFPNCDIFIHYSFKVCDGVTYFRLDAIGVWDTPECDAAMRYLLPGDWGSNANGERCAEVWGKSFYGIANEWFGAMSPKPICPNTISYKTITPGGCDSWTYAHRGPITPGGWPETRFVYVPCIEGGCCVWTKTMCWNEQTQQIDIETSKELFYPGDCETAVPLYDPFEGWPPEWERGPFAPCEEHCFIEF